MQTFLPLPDFYTSAHCLDMRRLGNQRREAKLILLVNQAGKGAWYNHPCAKMWRGHDAALAAYGIEICEEWKRRGYRDTLSEFFYRAFRAAASKDYDGDGFSMPLWFGDDRLHSSHRSQLLAKNREWYERYVWAERHSLLKPYWWPV